MSHSYIRVRWINASSDNPVELWSELDEDRWEVRKIEVFRDGRMGYACKDVETEGTWLGQAALPSLDDIAADPVFIPEEVTREDFEKQWAAALTSD